MTKIVILGANYYQRDLVLKAKSLGYETHVFGSGIGYIEKDKMEQAQEVADYFYNISVLDSEAVFEECKKIKPDGILTIGCDVAVPTISYVAQKLGLIGNSHMSALVSTNKWEMKKRFLLNKIPCARYILTDLDNYKKLPGKWSFPLMVKSIDQAGKCGITKIESLNRLEKAIQYALRENIKADKVLIEEYIEGKEYSAECISFEGEHTILNFTEKWNTEPHFVETMHLQPAPFDEETKNKITPIIHQALRALDIRYGASHTEFKITPEGKIKIIEIGARMAAESMWDVVDASTGNDYIKMAIDVCLGIPPTIKPSLNQTALVKFVMNQRDFNRLEWIKKTHPDKIYRLGYMNPIEDITIGKNKDRFGYYVLKVSSREEADYLM